MKIYDKTDKYDFEQSNACFCIGRQNGEPACPCQMRGMKQKNGRWVKEVDYGPVIHEVDFDSLLKYGE